MEKLREEELSHFPVLTKQYSVMYIQKEVRMELFLMLVFLVVTGIQVCCDLLFFLNSIIFLNIY